MWENGDVVLFEYDLTVEASDVAEFEYDLTVESGYTSSFTYILDNDIQEELSVECTLPPTIANNKLTQEYLKSQIRFYNETIELLPSEIIVIINQISETGYSIDYIGYRDTENLSGTYNAIVYTYISPTKVITYDVSLPATIRPSQAQPDVLSTYCIFYEDGVLKYPTHTYISRNDNVVSVRYEYVYTENNVQKSAFTITYTARILITTLYIPERKTNISKIVYLKSESYTEGKEINNWEYELIGVNIYEHIQQ